MNEKPRKQKHILYAKWSKAAIGKKPENKHTKRQMTKNKSISLYFLLKEKSKTVNFIHKIIVVVLIGERGRETGKPGAKKCWNFCVSVTFIIQFCVFFMALPCHWLAHWMFLLLVSFSFLIPLQRVLQSYPQVKKSFAFYAIYTHIQNYLVWIRKYFKMLKFPLKHPTFA